MNILFLIFLASTSWAWAQELTASNFSELTKNFKTTLNSSPDQLGGLFFLTPPIKSFSSSLVKVKAGPDKGKCLLTTAPNFEIHYSKNKLTWKNYELASKQDKKCWRRYVEKVDDFNTQIERIYKNTENKIKSLQTMSIVNCFDSKYITNKISIKKNKLSKFIDEEINLLKENLKQLKSNTRYGVTHNAFPVSPCKDEHLEKFISDHTDETHSKVEIKKEKYPTPKVRDRLRFVFCNDNNLPANGIEINMTNPIEQHTIIQNVESNDYFKKYKQILKELEEKRKYCRKTISKFPGASSEKTSLYHGSNAELSSPYGGRIYFKDKNLFFSLIKESPQIEVLDECQMDIKMLHEQYEDNFKDAYRKNIKFIRQIDPTFEDVVIRGSETQRVEMKNGHLPPGHCFSTELGSRKFTVNVHSYKWLTNDGEGYEYESELIKNKSVKRVVASFIENTITKVLRIITLFLNVDE